MMLADLEVWSSISSCMDVVPTTTKFYCWCYMLTFRVFFWGGGVCLHLRPPPLGTSLQPLLRPDVKGCHFLGCHFGDPQRRTKEMKNLSQLNPVGNNPLLSALSKR